MVPTALKKLGVAGATAAGAAIGAMVGGPIGLVAGVAAGGAIDYLRARAKKPAAIVPPMPTAAQIARAGAIRAHTLQVTLPTATTPAIVTPKTTISG